MANFDPAFIQTSVHEGGYVNDPHDRGGETKYGISKKAYPDIDIAALTFLDAQEIYRRDYWQPLHLDDISDQALAEQIFDTAINCGQRTAGRLLQDADNLISHGADLKTDGIIGPLTTHYINSYARKAELLSTIKGLRF
ncbi:MAG: secretion activating protein, partial [Desulfuromonadaceae bacterium]|nr:secretion activating protein [Desulfuromonadaceae bacterium]